MASYKIEISATAERQLRKIGRETLTRIMTAIEDLATNQRPRGRRKLRGFDDVYRIRVGKYRVIYSLDEKSVLIIILKVGHRKSIYR